jgi:hypothetical protein
MAANTRRRPARFDMQRAVAAHTEASQKARAWTEKAIALRAAEMPIAAARAEEKANYWLRKTAALKPLVKRHEKINAVESAKPS